MTQVDQPSGRGIWVIIADGSPIKIFCATASFEFILFIHGGKEGVVLFITPGFRYEIIHLARFFQKFLSELGVSTNFLEVGVREIGSVLSREHVKSRHIGFLS